jgi:hypothetical protein
VTASMAPLPLCCHSQHLARRGRTESSLVSDVAAKGCPENILLARLFMHMGACWQPAGAVALAAPVPADNALGNGWYLGAVACSHSVCIRPAYCCCCRAHLPHQLDWV